MNRFAAALLSLITAGCVSLFGIFGVVALDGFCRYPDPHSEERFQAIILCLVVFGLLAGALVYRGLRGRLSPGTIFHLTFGTGIICLAGCLWMVLQMMKIADIAIPARLAVGDYTEMGLEIDAILPITFSLVLIPVSLFVLSFSVAYDLIALRTRTSEPK